MRENPLDEKLHAADFTTEELLGMRVSEGRRLRELGIDPDSTLFDILVTLRQQRDTPPRQASEDGGTE